MENILEVYDKKAYLQYFQELNDPQMQHPRPPSWDICDRAKDVIGERNVYAVQTVYIL